MADGRLQESVLVEALLALPQEGGPEARGRFRRGLGLELEKAVDEGVGPAVGVVEGMGGIRIGLKGAREHGGIEHENVGEKAGRAKSEKGQIEKFGPVFLAPSEETKLGVGNATHAAL